MNSFKIRDCQKPSEYVSHFINEDIGIPPACALRKKKAGHADPRFKRLISTEFRCDTDEEGDKFGSLQKAESTAENQIDDKPLEEKVISYLKTPNDSTVFNIDNIKRIDDTDRQDLSDEVTKDPGFQPVESCTNSRLERKKSEFPAILKKSASDCTLNKKSALAEEMEDEFCEKIRAYPSATRLSKVQNWMKEHKSFPEKRRSVITVIGQTQTKPFSKILSEINQRRKLAKELDKHALCEAILGTACGQQGSVAKNLVAKVDLVLPDGKVIYSTEKVYMRKENKLADAVYSQKSMEILDINVSDRRKKMIPERDPLTNQSGKKSKAKRLSKKTASSSPRTEMPEAKGNVRMLERSTTSGMLLSVLAFISVAMCVSALFCSLKTSHTFSIVDFFKPKTTAWYEKLLF